MFVDDFNTNEQAILKVACENSLKAFIKVMHYYNNGAKFTFKPFHNQVIEALEKIAKYETTKNLILNLPVGFGKSQIVEYFISWTFARNKNICHLYTSYSDKLIQKLSSEVIDIIKSEPFSLLWNYTLKTDKKSRANWSIDGSVGRAGLTAGSIGGTITGLDAGNPAVKGFCGALICFPYNQKVWTEKGFIPIGEIVDKKLNIKVFSYNFDKKEIELQKIDNYVKNHGDDILKVTLSNGTSFECTKNHRVWTKNRGYIEAKDLINGIDEVLTVSNPFDLIDSQTSNVYNKLSTIVSISDKIKLFFIQFYFFAWFIINIFCKILKRLTSFNSLYRTYTTIKSFSDFSITSFIFCYINYILLGKFTSRKNKCSDFNSILHIFGFSTITKIFKTIVKGVRIKMSNFHVIRSNSNKCKHNKGMNIKRFNNSIFGKCNSFITSTIKILFKDFFRQIITSISFIVNKSFNRLNNSSIRNLIKPFIIRYVFVDDVAFVRHDDNSFCLTVHNNHNLFVGENQVTLVKNCDDPLKAGDEIYETKRDLVTEYFDRKLKTRLRRSDVPIILIMQRLHEEDLTGYIKGEGKYSKDVTNWQDDWNCITVKALDDNDQSIWEEKISTKALINERNRSPWVFYPQRQQEPDSNINTQFKGLRFESDKNLLIGGIAHVDKSFGGEDSTAFCIAKKVGDKIIVLGKKYDKHIDKCIDEIKTLCNAYSVKSVSTENNDDKGYIARANGWNSYHETMNKHYKIMTYLYTNWQDVYFLEDTDKEYIRQIQSYDENAAHDDCCFVAGTKIATLKGQTNIEEIKVGDLVYTPFGFKKVLATSKRFATTIENIGLIGTPNHKVFNKKKNNFLELKTFTSTSDCAILSMGEMIKWKILKLLNLTGKYMKKRENIISLKFQQTRAGGIVNNCIKRFGNFIIKGKFLKAFMFIIKILMPIITTLAIWLLWKLENIYQCMQNIILKTNKKKKIILNSLMRQENSLHYGINQKLGKNGIKNILKKYWKNNLKKMKKLSAHTAEGNLLKKHLRKFFVLVRVVIDTAIMLMVKLKRLVFFVVKKWNFTKNNGKENIVLMNVKKQTKEKNIVYNIKVDDVGCYYANNILVSNCDNLSSIIRKLLHGAKVVSYNDIVL